MVVRTLAAFKVAMKRLEVLPTTTPKLLRGDESVIYPYPRDYIISHMYECLQNVCQHSHMIRIHRSTRICVKFARMYSLDVHRFCASEGHAPKLVAYKPLPGGWNMIVINFIDSSSPHRASFSAVTSPGSSQ